jgi:hypothetical protein
MSKFTDPAVLPAAWITAVAAVSFLHAIARLVLMYWKRGRKPWSQAQLRFGRITAAMTTLAVTALVLLAYLTFTVPLTVWHAAAFTALVAAYAVVWTWYERRLFALADAT